MSDEKPLSEPELPHLPLRLKPGIAEREQRIAELEAELATAQRERDEAKSFEEAERGLREAGDRERIELDEQLTAAQARIRELEAELKRAIADREDAENQLQAARNETWGVIQQREAAESVCRRAAIALGADTLAAECIAKDPEQLVTAAQQRSDELYAALNQMAALEAACERGRAKIQQVNADKASHQIWAAERVGVLEEALREAATALDYAAYGLQLARPPQGAEGARNAAAKARAALAGAASEGEAK